MSRVQPFDSDENSEFDPQNPEYEGFSGVERIDDVLPNPDTGGPEIVPPPASVEPPASSQEKEIPADLKEKYGEGEWSGVWSSVNDSTHNRRFDFVTGEIIDGNRNESETARLRKVAANEIPPEELREGENMSAALHLAEHEAMVAGWKSNPNEVFYSQYVPAGEEEKSVYITRTWLEADGRIVSETFKKILEQEPKIVEDESGGDDDEEAAPVAAGYSAPAFSFSPEKTEAALSSVSAPEIQPAPAIAEARVSQPVEIAESKPQPVVQESFFQKIMRESTASVVQSEPLEHGLEKVPQAIISTPPENPKTAEIKEVVPVAPAVVVEQMREHARPPQLEEQKIEPVEKPSAVTSETVTNKPEALLISEVSAVIEKTADVSTSSVEVTEKSVEIDPTEQVKIIPEKEVAEGVEKNTAEAEVVNTKVETGLEAHIENQPESPVAEVKEVDEAVEAGSALKVEVVETKMIAEPTYEEMVAVETGISLEPENTIETIAEAIVKVEREGKTEVSEVPEISEHHANVTVAAVEVTKNIIEKKQAAKRVEYQEEQILFEDTGIELVEFDQELAPEIEVVAVVAKESPQVVVDKPAVVAAEKEYTLAIDAGIELLAEIETEEIVAETTEVRIEVAHEKVVAVIDSTEAEELVVEKPAVQEVVSEKILESENVEKSVIVMQESTPETVADEPKVIEKEVVTDSNMPVKKNETERAEIVAASDSDAIVKVRTQPVVGVVNKKNAQESLIKRQSSGAAVINVDEENEAIRQDRELEAFEVAFA